MALVKRRAPRDAGALEGREYVAKMSPTQHKRSLGILMRHMTSRRALSDAWSNVKPRVVNSKDPATRSSANKFDQNTDLSIHRLQRALRSNSFKFEDQRGILKIKKTAPGNPRKDPRPIVISPVANRIVQRAILDVCQSQEPGIARNLGSLPQIIQTPTSVGGLPGRGVPEAISLISETIKSGAKWYIRSDLKKFFQTIPKPNIQAFLRANIQEPQFVELFMAALETELCNEEEVREHLNLFPTGDVGVPQGSALSALCANIVLAEFDAKLNGRGIITVRYLDDFVILGPSKKAVDKAWLKAKEILARLKMEAHEPSSQSGKANSGELANGFDFLSYTVNDKDAFPTAKCRKEFLNDIKKAIKKSKDEINSAGDNPRRAEPRFVQSLALLDRKIRGWGDAFSATSKPIVLAQLDKKIDEILAEYLRWYTRARQDKSVTHKRRILGIALLADTKLLD